MRWRLDPGQIEVVDEDVAAILRQKTPAEKMTLMAAANRTGRMMVEAGVRMRNPGWADEQVRREVARMMSHDPG